MTTSHPPNILHKKILCKKISRKKRIGLNWLLTLTIALIALCTLAVSVQVNIASADSDSESDSESKSDSNSEPAPKSSQKVKPVKLAAPVPAADKSVPHGIIISHDSNGITITAGELSDSLGTLRTLRTLETPESPAFPVVLIPQNRVSVTKSPPDTVFENSIYKNGSLIAEDSLGRQWIYDREHERFNLSWEEVSSSGSGRESMVYINGYDTVIVTRDRDPEWAQTLKRVRKTNTRAVHVRVDEYVTRDIICAKKVTVDGLVDGDVISLKEVVVGRTGVINGNVNAPSIKIRSGGLITGSETEVGAGFETIPEDWGRDARRVIDFGGIPVFVGLATLLILVAFISLSVAPDAVSRASDAISAHTWTTVWVGMVTVLVLPIVLGILSITFVGIPLAVIGAVATPVAVLVGIVAYSLYSGQTALAAYGISDSTRLRKIVVGILILIGLWTLAFALQSSRADFLSGIGIILLITAGVFSAVAVFAGIGGVALTRFGRRVYTPTPAGKGYPPPPSPPPTPQPPPMPYRPAPPAPPAPPDLK